MYQNVSKVRDGFEYAINWKRVFIDLYRHLEWLNSYAEINELASKKILKKFNKNFFLDKNNNIIADIDKYLNTLHIGKR
jgi:hypothetical protein